jgi:NADH-quinone oxidoreductase subunit G
MIVGGGALAKDGAHGDTLKLVETLGLVKDGWNGLTCCTSRRRAWAG